jgi:glycosyltransferase involved in cell wall biosynthesis
MVTNSQELVLNRITFLIPCHNEEITLAKVISDIRAVSPNSKIIVGDNNSTDRTRQIAIEHNVDVVIENFKGKGLIVRKLLENVETQYCCIVDGDSTYDLSNVPQLFRAMLEENIDMVIGSRVYSNPNSERRGHRLGNKLFVKIFNSMFSSNYTDVLSGFRILNRRFMNSFPINAKGFEIEIEMNAHAKFMNFSYLSMPINYYRRPEGSQSKLNTFQDGIIILFKMMRALRSFRPFRYFLVMGMPGLVVAFLLFLRAGLSFLETGLVPYLPSLVVGSSILIVIFSGLLTGMILESIAEVKLSILNKFISNGR